MNKKENWEKPKLIVLTRGKSEESVLIICKRQYTADIGPEGFPQCTKVDTRSKCSEWKLS